MNRVEPTASREAFLDGFGEVFEHSPWIAERAWERLQEESNGAVGPMTAEGLLQAFSAVIHAATTAEKLSLLLAHPELAVAVGRDEPLTEASQSEQRGAGLDRCNADEYRAFADLNRRYRERFGFPFIMAVKGFHRSEILDALTRRVENNREQEFETAVDQVIRIGRLRTAAILATEKMNNE